MRGDALDTLIEGVTDGLAADIAQAGKDFSDALYRRLDDDAAILQALAKHEQALRDQLREAEVKRDEADARYRETQRICTLANMLGFLDKRAPAREDA